MRTRVMRRLSLLAAVALLASACGGGGDDAAEETTETEANDTEATDTETEDAADEGEAASESISGDIRLLTPIFEGTDGKEALEGDVLVAFNEQYPDVNVTVEYTTYGDLNEKLTTSLASGLVPDVMMMGVGWVEGFADQGVLADYDQFGDSVDALGDDFTTEVLQAGVWEDKLYALPIMLDARLGLYRADLLEEAGVEPPSGPTWSWDEVREAAVALTERNGGSLERAGLDLLSWDERQIFEVVLFSNGGELFDNGEPVFDSPEGVEALEWYADLIAEDGVIEPGFEETGSDASLINQGLAAMAIGHNNVWTNAADFTPEVQDQLKPFILENERPAFFHGGTLVTMSADSQSPEAAHALAKHLASPDAALIANEQRGNVPAHKALLDSDYVQGNELARFVMENLEYAKPEGGHPAWLEIRSEFATAVEYAYRGEKTPEQALTDLAEHAREAIERYDR